MNEINENKNGISDVVIPEKIEEKMIPPDPDPDPKIMDECDKWIVGTSDIIDIDMFGDYEELYIKYSWCTVIMELKFPDVQESSKFQHVYYIS
eukprot:UN33411